MPKPGGNPENLIPIKKGEVRNPKGKPKGTKNWSTIIKKAMNTKVNIKEHPLTKKPGVKMTVREMITFAMIKEAAAGNVSAFEKLADREQGKVMQKVEASGSEGGPIILRWADEAEDIPKGENNDPTPKS